MGESPMHLMRRLTLPVSDSTLSLVLAASLIVMALLLWAILWQSSVIGYQRDLIRQIWSGTYPG